MTTSRETFVVDNHALGTRVSTLMTGLELARNDLNETPILSDTPCVLKPKLFYILKS
jgi:hypothetical protein